MSSRNVQDMEVSSTPKRKDITPISNEAKISKFSHDSGGGGGSSEGGAGSGDPIPMAMPQHQRAVDNYRFKAAGTTFVGTGVTSSGDNNNWYRFPWETCLPFINDWSAIEVSQKWLYWKTKTIHLTIKNPICIQDIGSTTSALATAGQNLHANLYGYTDNLYLRGTQCPFAGTSLVEMGNLLNSWKNHGYNNGQPINLPLYRLTDTPGMFQNNWPDVKQCGMGPGKSLDFHWNVNNKYWRNTDLFNSVPQLTTGEFNGALTCRWDERLGMISQMFSGSNVSGTSITSASAPCSLNMYIGVPNGVSKDDRSEWRNVTFQTIFGAQPFCHLYIDPDPMPGLYLQLQPQMGAITAGIGNSICQVQWEISIDIECTGRLPRMVKDTTITVRPNDESKFSGRPNVLSAMAPLYYDICFLNADNTQLPS